jgi:transposase
VTYREVSMVELKEVLRQWLGRTGKKRIAARMGMDPKTVRRYVRAAEGCGLRAGAGDSALSEEVFAAIVAALSVVPTREHGDAWRRCEEHRQFIEDKLKDRVKLTKVRRLLRRRNVVVPYSTLHRFVVTELGFGRPQVTLPVMDGVPGEELQVDTGWMVSLEPDGQGRRRRFRAWIFTPSVSRYRFVWPCLKETTQTAIEACEAAWEFYGGVFRVLVPDNTKAIVQKADPLQPKLIMTFLEYAQARGFVIDPCRVRKATDKARVERAVKDVRDDCYGGERVLGIDDAHRRALHWCREEYGMRRHSTTQRLPREHFDAVEKAALLPAPTEPYDIPIWGDPKVGRDHFAQFARALYTLPTRFIGRRLRARADSQLVRFYEGATLVKTHARQPPGGKAIDENDFPADRRPYAMRDVVWLQKQSCSHGESIGMFAERLLDSRLPWTKMRSVRALLGLCRRYGDERVEQACARALAADMLSVYRLERMLKAAAPALAPPTAKVIPIGRYLRPAQDYCLPRRRSKPKPGDET